MTSEGTHDGDTTTSYALQPPDRPAAEGRLIGGRYRLRSRLGQGGMGTVWRAYDELMDREVAVKEPRIPETVPEAERAMLYERMHREARAAARISHPSVITLHDVVTVDGQPWLVMELVRGQSLDDVLDSGTLDVMEAARVGLAVLNALAAAHEVGVTHRDVKPANVLMGSEERVVLSDFGIARLEGEQGLTDTGALIGSPEYMAPELALGQRPGPASDLWSLGVLLYVAVEGVSPFRRSHAAATFHAVISAETPRPLQSAGPLGELITRMLDKSPAARPEAAEVRRVLRAAMAPPAAPQVASQPTLSWTAPGPQAEPGKRRRRLGRGGLIGLATGTLALAAALTLLWTTSPGGGGLPDGWEVREEPDFRMNIAVPEGYTRSVEDAGVAGNERDNPHVLYTSPDGIYIIEVWLRPAEPSSPLQAAGAQLADFEERTATYDEVEGDFWESEFQEGEAAEMYVTTLTDPEEPRLQRNALFYGVEEDETMWRVQVVMPGEEGEAMAHGEELYADVIDNLELDVADAE
ncbi:serine/threonine-protein kinase [Streptomyces mayteni]